MGTIATATATTTSLTVHPHGRGDNHPWAITKTYIHGSPPRAWGQCRRAGRHEPQRRFTPTGVGTIKSLPVSSYHPPVHPHGRGDNPAGRRIDPPLCGSPPRAWGQCPSPRTRRRTHRFTPTGVGTIRAGVQTARRAAVHPHGRGDNLAAALARAVVGGSPPRAWGQYKPLSRETACRRFTPTGVGTILTPETGDGAKTVHPHGRGDNQQRSRRRVAFLWFTPTGVGTIERAAARLMSCPVHPHGRGDNARGVDAPSRPRGSPPRAWGQSSRELVQPRHDRFTPTGVGTIR